MFVDLAIKEKKLVIEVDGPHHHLFGDKEKLLSHYKFNREIIQRMGFTVKTLETDEYNAMSSEEK